MDAVAGGAYLVVREDQRVSQNNILSSSSCKNNNLCYIIRSQGLAACVDCVGFCFVAVKSDYREFLGVFRQLYSMTYLVA